MGVVFRAHDLLMNEPVAIKMMNPHLLRTQRGQQLFILEAQMARRLRHENIVAVHDVGCTPEGILYLTMEFLEGQSLRAFLQARRGNSRHVEVALAVRLTAQVLAALEYAHRKIVHRDIKPENVMLLPGEWVKVLDFGLAKAIDEESAEEPASEADRGRVTGTAAYAAPEQKKHQAVDLRADIYSTGLLLYELLTLRTPLDKPVTIAAVRSDVAPGLITVLQRSLQADKENRWQSAGEFRTQLLRAFEESYRPVSQPQVQVAGDRPISTKGMVLLEGGSFLMGNNVIPDEAPEFEAYVEPFYMDIYPVTRLEYEEFLVATGHPKPKFWGVHAYAGPDQPVVGVTWMDANAYAAWAGKQLPTEVQWEFAARGKQNRRYPWGNQEPDPTRANYGDHLNMPSIVTMHEDGMTPEGIHDLAGNVYEWTADPFVPYKMLHNGDSQRSTEPRRSVRGGCWQSPPGELRCAFRKGLFPDAQLPTVGFRCVLPLRTTLKTEKENNGSVWEGEKND